jgi:hypothetical protein
VELDALAQVEGRALGVLGELVTLGQRQMIVFLLTGIFDQGIVQSIEEVVGRRRAVVLLRVEPARSDVGVPGEHHFTLRDDCGSCAAAAQKRRRESRRRQRCCLQHRAPCQRRPSHISSIAKPRLTALYVLSSMSSHG